MTQPSPRPRAIDSGRAGTQGRRGSPHSKAAPSSSQPISRQSRALVVCAFRHGDQRPLSPASSRPDVRPQTRASAGPLDKRGREHACSQSLSHEIRPSSPFLENSLRCCVGGVVQANSGIRRICLWRQITRSVASGRAKSNSTRRAGKISGARSTLTVGAITGEERVVRARWSLDGTVLKGWLGSLLRVAWVLSLRPRTGAGVSKARPPGTHPHQTSPELTCDSARARSAWASGSLACARHAAALRGQVRNTEIAPLTLRDAPFVSAVVSGPSSRRCGGLITKGVPRQRAFLT